MEIDGVIVHSNFDISETEARNYIEYVKARRAEPLLKINVTLCGDGTVYLDYTLQAQRFERIRRITGCR